MGKKLTPLPALSDEWTLEDSINYTPYIEALTKTILECETPFTMGLYGPWGKGKTSTMRLIEKNLQEKDKNKNNIITIFYNPWEYQFDEHLIVPLLHTIRYKINKSKWGKVKTSSFVEKFDNVIFGAAYVLSERIGFKAKDFVETANVRHDLKEKEKAKNLSFLTEGETIKKLFESAIDELIGEGERKIVIFVDDLDRCLPEYALKILEAIKIYLSVKGCVFVLGVEKKMIQNAILYHYREVKEGTFSGKDYLDKLIQLSYNLPDMRKIGVGKLLYKISKKIKLFKNPEEKKKCIEIVQECIDPIPRTVKRFVNSIILQENIREELKKTFIKKKKFDLDIKNIIKLRLIYFINENLSLSKQDLWELQERYRNPTSTKRLPLLKEKYGDITPEHWVRIEKIIKYAEPFKEEEIGKYLEVLCPEELKSKRDKNTMKIIELKRVRKIRDCTAIINTVLTLGQIGDESAIPELIETLTSSNDAVYAAVVSALEQIGDKLAISKIEETLESKDNSNNVEFRCRLILALGQIGSKSVIPFLTDLYRKEKKLENGNTKVKLTAIETLGYIGDKDVIPALEEALDDGDKKVRFLAVWGLLGQIQHKQKILSILEDALKKEPDPEVRYKVVLVLEQIGGGEVIPLLENTLLNDKDAEVKRKIILVLEYIGSEKGTAAAVKHNREVISALEKAVKDNDIGKEVTQALERLRK
ncbi:MAG: P-loop NTPase fold protein [bacterium]|nr:P-loop NTPase fold protein [bacterium]